MNTELLLVGDSVYWTLDDEHGTLRALTEHSITIEWDESGIEVYSLSCGAIDRIEPRTERFSCDYKR